MKLKDFPTIPTITCFFYFHKPFILSPHLLHITSFKNKNIKCEEIFSYENTAWLVHYLVGDSYTNFYPYFSSFDPNSVSPPKRLMYWIFWEFSNSASLSEPTPRKIALRGFLFLFLRHNFHWICSNLFDYFKTPFLWISRTTLGTIIYLFLAWHIWYD